MSAQRLIVGCGYLGTRAARLWTAAGDVVWAVTRSTDRAQEFARQGIKPIVGDVTDRGPLAALPAVESLLFAVGFDPAGGADLHEVYAGGLRRVLATVPASTDRVIYISTTGAYGGGDGGWVDESTPPDPHREGGRASLAAERVLAEHPLGGRSAVLRLAGIYGPGRVPHLDKLRAGEPLPVSAEGWLNLIHVDDAARIVVAADTWLAHQPPGEAPHVFCVSDGFPVRRGEYYAEVARVLGAAPPRFVEPLAGSPAAARAGVSRRVRNDRMRETLGAVLDYPSYRAGLAAILGASAGPRPRDDAG
jgi:nucleoside-diphosphate-sugar epimerase